MISYICVTECSLHCFLAISWRDSHRKIRGVLFMQRDCDAIIYLLVSSSCRYAFLQGNKMQEAGNVRALRCQLPRENSYYESHPSKDDFPRVQKQESDKTCSHDPWNVVETEVRLAKAENPPNCERILFPEHQLVTDYEEAPSIQ